MFQWAEWVVRHDPHTAGVASSSATAARAAVITAPSRGRAQKPGSKGWGPSRLRHSTATYLRNRFAIESARVVLNHRSSANTVVDAELDRTKAAVIMAAVG